MGQGGQTVVTIARTIATTNATGLTPEREARLLLGQQFFGAPSQRQASTDRVVVPKAIWSSVS
jgi:hypothetical protein